MTHTPNNNYGVTPDDNADVPQGMQNVGSLSENEIFLERMLGVRLPQNIGNIDATADLLANQISYRIASAVDRTRTRVEQVELKDVLDARLKAALNRVHDVQGGLSTSEARFQSIRAVADAVRESVREEVLVDFMRNEMAAALDVQPGVPRNILRARIAIDGAPGTGTHERDVFIDTRHSFWRERNFRNRMRLRDELSGKTLQELGINIGNPSDVPVSYKLTKDDATRLVNYNLDVINLRANYRELDETVTSVAGEPVNFYVNVRGLAGASLDDHPRLRTQKYAGNLSRAEMRNYLLHNPDGNFSYWNRWVNGLGADPQQKVVDAAGATRPAVDVVLDRIFESVTGSAASAGPLAVSQMKIHEIQNELSQLHRHDTRLREGSDNTYGAALAASLAAGYPDVASVLNAGDATLIEGELNRLKQQKYVHDALDRMRAEAPSVTVGGVDTSMSSLSYADLQLQRADLADDVKTARNAGVPSTIAGWKSAYMTFHYPGAAISTNDDKRELIKAAQDATKELNAVLSAYQKIEFLLQSLKFSADAAGVSSTTLDRVYFGGGTAVVHSALDAKFNMLKVAQDLETEMNSGATKLVAKDELQGAIDGKQAELAKAQKGGPSGDEAQHLVIRQYLQRYRGLTESEASAATNYLRARALLDGDMNAAAEAVSSDIFGEEPVSPLYDRFRNVSNLSYSPEQRTRSIVYQVGYFAGVPMKRNSYSRSPLSYRYYLADTPEPNWSKANFRSLTTAYFALKQLYEGAGPQRLRLYQTKFVQDQMKEITRLLLQKHAQATIKIIGSGRGLSEERQREIMRDPSKAEHLQDLEALLSGPAPSDYQPRIHSVISSAEANTDWWRRNLLLREDYGMLKGKKNKVSARNLLWGNEYASAAGLGYRAPTRIAKAVGSGTATVARETWKRRVGIGAGALIGTLFLPGIGTAIGAAIGSSHKPNA